MITYHILSLPKALTAHQCEKKCIFLRFDFKNEFKVGVFIQGSNNTNTYFVKLWRKLKLKNLHSTKYLDQQEVRHITFHSIIYCG
jgi:hypothetical protein